MLRIAAFRRLYSAKPLAEQLKEIEKLKLKLKDMEKTLRKSQPVTQANLGVAFSDAHSSSPLGSREAIQEELYIRQHEKELREGLKK